MKYLLALLLMIGTANAQTYNPGGGGTNPLPIAQGGTSYNFPNFYPALVNTINSTSNTRVCFAGDSTTFGVYSNGTMNGNFPPLSYPTQLATVITSKYGVIGTQNAFMGDQGSNQTLANDFRVTVGSSWTQTGETIGGGFLTASTTTNALSFLPTNNVDTFRIVYQQASGNGTIGIAIDGGTATNYSTSGASGLATVTVTAGSVGSHTVSIKYVSGGSVYVAGIEAWNSAIPSVSVINAGWSGSSSVDWNVATNAWSSANSAAWIALGCKLVGINLGINDWQHATLPSTFSTNIQALITAAKASGADVVLMTPVPTSAGGATISSQLALVAILKTLAASNNIPLIDFYDRWQSYAISQPYGLYGDTNTHPNQFGYADNANTIASSIMPYNVPNNSLGFPATTTTQYNAQALSIGTSYAGVYAPTNGAMIQGNVAIGTTVSTAPLTVSSSSSNTAQFVALGTTTNNVNFDTPAGATVNINLLDGGVLKYQITKNTTNQLIVYDAPNNKNIMQVATSGNMNIGENTNIHMVGTGGTTIGGTSTSGGVLAVSGSQSIGAAYVSSVPPTDGLIVVGSIGIGTASPLATLHVNGTVKTAGYTVSGLPTGSIGMKAYVTDQTATCAAAGAVLTGGGAITCPVFFNGSAWVGD